MSVVPEASALNWQVHMGSTVKWLCLEDIVLTCAQVVVNCIKTPVDKFGLSRRSLSGLYPRVVVVHTFIYPAKPEMNSKITDTYLAPSMLSGHASRLLNRLLVSCDWDPPSKTLSTKYMISVLTGHHLLTKRTFSPSTLYNEGLNTGPMTVSRFTPTPTVIEQLTSLVPESYGVCCSLTKPSRS